MSRANPFLTTGILLVFVLVYGSLPWVAGGLFLDNHEGDSYHFLDILLRMEAGQVPHLDFVTPLGVLTFLPIVLLIKAGFSAGAATILAQLGGFRVVLPSCSGSSPLGWCWLSAMGVPDRA